MPRSLMSTNESPGSTLHVQPSIKLQAPNDWEWAQWTAQSTSAGPKVNDKWGATLYHPVLMDSAINHVGKNIATAALANNNTLNKY